MYQSLIITLSLIIGFQVNAKAKNETEKVIASNFSEYTKAKSAFLKSSLTKQNLHGELTKFLEKSEQILTKIEDAEKAQFPNEDQRILSEEGSIIALESATFDPLVRFAESSMENADCKRALSDISLDKPNDGENFANVVESVVKKICR